MVVIVAAVAGIVTTHKPATTAPSTTPTTATVNFNVAPLSVPIYVVGPVSLVEELASVSVNASLIKPIPLNALPSLPNGSVVLVYWPFISGDVIVGDSGRVYVVNLTSPVFGYLASTLARGGIVGIYANASLENVVEFTLAYVWARAVNNTAIAGAGLIDYMFAYPTIPVNAKEPMIIVARWVKPRGLVIGPIYLSQLQQFIVNTMKLVNAPPTINGVIDNEDPCYAEYQQYTSQQGTGVYTNGESTLIWAAPMFYGTSDNGVQAYYDGNGTFYWDTCLAVGNSIYEVQYPGYAPAYYLPAQIVGYGDYYENSTMYNSSWNPPPTSSTSSYTVSFGITVTGIPSLSVGISLPSGTSESISDSQNSAAETSLPSVSIIQVSNITWTFNIYQSAQAGFPNAFEDITPVNIFLPNFNQLQSYYIVFNVDFENYAVTSQVLCGYYTTETIWADVEWDINVVPQSATTANVTGSPSMLNALPNYPYVSGVSSSLVWTPCPPS
ncbi:hypothetical protein [Vulcanisaeta moutnovskia]|uniref:hypothetical protein n=1 Tax=Vulcanisaeta moutnovskia TaxID=985052 RepID=UPI001ED91DA1|nr:hypothetical protein [Vulcanisaeta moutnovskia]